MRGSTQTYPEPRPEPRPPTHLLPGPALCRVGRSPGEALIARERIPGGAEAAGWGSRGTQLSVWAQPSAASRALAWTHVGGCWAPEPAQPGGGWGPCMEHDCPESELSAVCLSVPLSVPPWSLRRKPAASRWTDAQGPTAASGRGSGPLTTSSCAGMPWTVSLTTGRNSRCVFPPLTKSGECVGGQGDV